MKKWCILSAMCLMLIIFNIDFTATNLALAPIANELHSNMSSLQWVINGYSLAIACTLLMAGRISDAVGKYRIYVLGTVLFLAGSFFCGIAQNVESLIIARIVQGVGGGIASPVMLVLAFQAFPESKRGMALGIAGSSVGFGQAFGPSIGGFLIHFFNWHWIFYINIPVTVISMLTIWLCFKYEHETIKVADIKTFDWRGSVLLALFIIFYCYPLNSATKTGFGPFEVLMLLTAIIFFAMLIFTERKQKNPLLHFDILKNKMVMKFIVMRFFFQGLVFTAPFIIALYCQNVLGFSALKTGNLLLIGIIFFAFISPFSGKYFDRLGGENLSALGFAMLLISMCCFAIFSYQQQLVLLISGLIVFGIGYGILQPCITLGPLKYSEPKIAATASGFSLTLAVIGGITSIALIGLIYSFASQIIFSHAVGFANFAQLQQTYPALIDIIHGAQQISVVSNIVSQPLLAFSISANLANSLSQALRIAMLTNTMIACAMIIYSLKKTK